MFLALAVVIIYGFALSYFYLFESFGKHDAQHILNLKIGFPIYSGDPTQYVTLGKNMIFHQAFSEYLMPPYIPNTMRTPAYPLITALLRIITGSFLSVSFFQILLVFGIAASAYLIGIKLVPPSLSLAAAVLFLLDPTAIAYTLVAFTDIS